MKGVFIVVMVVSFFSSEIDAFFDVCMVVHFERVDARFVCSNVCILF